MSARLDGLTSPVFTDFVKTHESEDVSRLLLSKQPDGIDLREAADQILSKRKAKSKLPLWSAQMGVVFPPPLSIEQSSSEAAAHYKKNLLKGDHLIDLTGGMGVDLLALSDQFSQATHVEIDPWLSEVFMHNAPLLSQNSITAMNISSEEFLVSYKGKATFFIDPARRDVDKKKVFLFGDCSPNVIEMLPEFKIKADKVLVKAAPMIDISLGMQQLEYVSEVHVVSVDNECKEVLFLLDFSAVIEPIIYCINLTKMHAEAFTFTQKEEKSETPNLGEVGKYLYEPNASIRKAGAFKSVASRFQLKKLAINTHLYTSDLLVSDFPGRVFEVLGSVDKKKIKRQFPDGRANVISKNHPLTPEQIKQKFKLKDGGEQFLIAFRDRKGVGQMEFGKKMK